MKKSLFILLSLALLCTLMAKDPNGSFERRDLNPTPSNAMPELSRDLWDNLLQFDVDTPTGQVGLAGMEWDGEFFYATKWSGSNQLYKFDSEGNYIEAITVPLTGARDLAYDGEYMYGSAATSAVVCWDSETGEAVPENNINVAGQLVRAIAYDPLTDTFWSGNWGDPVVNWDRDGNVINTLNFGTDLYGLAFDPDDPEGPFLYAHQQTPGCILQRIDPETGDILESTDVTGQGGTGAIAGGLCYMNDWDPALRTLGALLQGAPDYICVYELGENAPPDAPAAPDMFTVTPDPNGGLTADLGWMNPTETVMGDDLTDLDEMRVYRNDELIHTITDPVIGGVVNWTDNLPEAGSYNYTVLGFNDAGEGVGASANAYIGEDVPAAVTSITLANVDGNGELSWANPTAGLHGGPFNEPIEGYHIVRSDGEEFEPTGIMTTWTDDTIPEEGLYAYTITPYNSIGDGGSASSEMTWIGDSQAAMFGDPNTTTAHYYTPIDFWYKNSLSQTIYYVDEFAAQGFGGGAITAIMYYNNFVDNLPGMPINIWMQNTTLENLSGGWESATDMTQVFSGNLDFPSGVNEIMIDLDEPFIYEGQNLIVFVERVMDTQYYSTGDTFYYTDTQYTDRCLWAQSDSDDYDPYNPPTTINYLSSNPNTMMFINTTGLGQMAGYAYNTDNNEPLEGVLIELMEQRIHTFTDANGHYSFPGLFEGTYEAHATLFAHSEDIETVVIVADETTDQDFYLQPVPEVEVTGRVVGSDYPDIGLADAEVTLSGMGVHEGITDEEGYFNINTVYASNTYQLVVVAEGYEVLVGEAVIGAGNTDLGDLVVNEIAFPAYDVIATQNEDDTVVDLIWHGPNPSAGNFWDFESDDGEFVANMGWAWGTDNMAGAYSGDNVWGTTLNAQYPNSVSYELVTPEMNIPTDDAVLTFWHWMDIETTFDGGNIKVSTDGGTSWTLITPVGGYPGTAYGLNSEACFNGHGMVWTLATFEIGTYQGEDVMFKFHFGSDSSVTYQGWYIDDVYVGMPEDRLMHPNNPNFHPIANLLPHNNERIIENYNIYLLLMGEEENEESWETIATAVEDTVYSDPTWADLESEIYEYAVKAVYTNNVLADPAISNWVGKDMIATLEVTLTTNVGDIPAGATVYLEATEPDPVGDYPEYSGITDENGECTIIGIWKSNYDLIASYPGFSTLTDNIDILEDVVTYTGMIYEEANSPYDVLAEVNVEDTECDLIWNSPGTWPSYEIIYDDDEAENATAWYDADNERAVWFTAQGGPCMVSGGSMHIYDGTWPAGNILTPFTAAVWAYDEATGMPGEMLGSVLVTPTDYFWVSFEFDEPIAIDGTEFFLGYLQGGAYPDCAGIGIDETPPTMGRSYEHYVTGGTPWAFSSYQDFMLRAMIQGPTGRQITVSYDNPTVDFSSIVPHKGAINVHAHNLPQGIQEVGNARYMPVHNTNPFSTASNWNTRRDRELIGYNIIRGEFGDQANWAMWNVVEEMVEDTTYTDLNWVSLEDGTVYTYGVRSIYTNNNMSDPAFSNWVGKDMYATLEIALETNIGDIPVGAEVTLEATEPDPDGNYPEYTGITDDAGECTITGIWKGNYDLKAELLNFATLEDNIEIMEDVVTYEGMITEMMYPAFDVYVEENHAGNAWLTWHSPAGSINSFFDFEDNDGEFIGEAGWEWANGCNAGNAWSGENCWSCYPNAQYPNSANTGLYTPVISVPSDESQLIFYHWYDIESSWDGGNIKISLDEGTSWTIIDPIGGYPGTAIGLNGEVCYNGNSGGWVMAAFDLSIYDGEDVMFKFHFGSDSSVTYPGWDIDDVYVGEPEDRGRPIELFTSKETALNSFSKASDTDTRRDRMDGYTLLRGFADDMENFEDWDLIAETLQDTTYEDTTWPEITEPGVYMYCVRAEYTGGVLSEPSFSNEIGFDMYVPVTVNVSGNSGDPMDGAMVTLECQDGVHSYEAEVSGVGVYWEEVWKGVYDMTVHMDGYEDYVENDMWITDTMVMNVELLENIYPPSNVAVDEETGLVTWEAPGTGGANISNILFVDDDGSADLDFTDTQTYYTDMLDATGIDYEVFEIAVSGDDGPDAAYMADYALVIWECGEQWQGSNTLTTTDEAELGTYLDGGGFLVLSGHDYLWDRYPSAGAFSAGQFPYDYLGLASANQDAFTVGTSQGGPEFVDIDGAGCTDGLAVQLQDIFSALRDGVYLDFLTPNADGAAYSTYDGNNVGVQTANTIFTTAGWAGIIDGDNTVDEYVLASLGNFAARDRHVDYYNVYLDDDLVGQTTETQFQLTGLSGGVTYTAGVSAHYSSNMESEIIEVIFTPPNDSNDPNVIPEITALDNNYPNPFNPVTYISYGLAEDGMVRIEVYNVKGQRIKTLINENMPAGTYQAIWNGTDDNNRKVASGIYFYKMKSGRYTSTKKMILMK